MPGPALHGPGTPPPTWRPRPSAHLGDVLDGSCQGLLLCLVLNREILTKVTKHLPGVGSGRGHGVTGGSMVSPMMVVKARDTRVQNQERML